METENRDQHIASKENLDYWNNVDLYIGGSEHATGHLLYSRFWTKFLNDKGVLPVDEPFKKLINQGMILGESAFVYRVDFDFAISHNINQEDIILIDKVNQYIENNLRNPTLFISKNQADKLNESGWESLVSIKDFIENKEKNIKKELSANVSVEVEFRIHHDITPIHVDVSLVNTSNELDIEGLKNWRSEFSEAEFILKNGELYDPISSPSGRSGGDSFVVAREVEKMSKSKFNVVNPDDICEDFGADSLRLYEMFLGPLEQAKPWSTAGLSGVHNFLKKLWKLYSISKSPQEEGQNFVVSDEPASKESLKTLHKTIKKVTQDIEEFSFNTSVSTFMICVNELTQQKCNSRDVLEPLTVLISPYAPHIAEELWELLGNATSISEVDYPVFEEHYLKEDSKTYPISFNGKMRFTLDLSLDLSKDEIEKIVMADERTQKQMDGRTPKKVIIVPGKIVNIVG
jgi:leucyl-tRNA synthetase